MTGLGLAGAWAAVVVAARARRGPMPARVRALVPAPPAAAGRSGSGLGAPPLVAGGMAVGSPAVWLLAVGLLAVARPLGLAVVVAAALGPRLRARRRARAAVEAVVADLPEVVDLLRMCVGAGLTVPLAVAAVARRAEGPVARALADALAVAGSRGRRLADALEDVPVVLGESVRALVGVLVGSERYGHAIGAGLERLADECRADERRRAESAARRVPVLLLFPLVVCVLPAFALLTVAPLLAGALRALRL
ncbi:MAG: tight adherence protein [Acidimicrobiaceae bacterium]|nr:tight adherence protein [Acidimicrobiaceae bacterium]